ncbi:unnamed protein product [Peronospora farinosa]|uniref:Serine aminopeptidase S33 domain-containing protein n=1 Tax=Peronospora farinosa TaxID=134698 RepID=A0AAV0TK22_9STRA|nr:unnamed protein product [Peronospora farinosa]CAI5722889.1 unnamed protein product [Peronospora farinosa]
MTLCRKGPAKNSRTQRLHAAGRKTLAMSVIVEEPANMRESRLSEWEKHPDDIQPNNDSFIEEMKERPRRSTQDCNALVPSDQESKSKSGSVSSSTSTTSSSSDEYHNSKTLQNQLQSPCAGPPSNQSSNSRAGSPLNQSSDSRTRYRETLDKYARTRRSIPSRSELRFNSSNFSSLEEEQERYDYYGRPSRRNTTLQSSDTDLNTLSICQSKASATSKGERYQSPLYNSPDERPRSKSSARLNFILSSSSNDKYECRWRKEFCHASQSRSRSQERCRSVSSSSFEVHGKCQMPPFRRPSCPVGDDIPSSYSSSEQTSAEERVHHGMPSHDFEATSPGRANSFSPPNSLASFSENESVEDRRLRAFKDASPLPLQRSASSSYPDGQCQLASCSESNLPATLNSKVLSFVKPSSRDKLQPSSRLLSSPRDSPRMRSTVLLTKKSPTAASSGDPIPSRSPTASIFPAIASEYQLRISAPEAPLRLRHYEGRFLNRRNQTLFYFSLFPPEKMPLRGVVLYLHGLGDHCRRNVNMYERLCREGFGVITYDLLNHGVSDLDQQRTRAHISDFTHLVEDTNDFITFVKRSLYTDALRYWRKHHQRYHFHGQESDPDMALLPELPLIVAGTSFGSLIGIHTILSGEHHFHAAVWGSPTIGVTWNPLLWAESKLAKPLAAVMPTAKLVPAIHYDLLCRDPKFLRRFKADPLTSMDMMTTRTGHESLQAMIKLQEDERITDPSSAFCAVPMLFLAGSADGISDQQAAVKFFTTMGNFDKEFKLFDGLFHLVYEEPEKESVFRHLIQWLHRRFPDD